ncbi:MAG: AAA family ATPase [Thermomicrobiales bacterium]
MSEELGITPSEFRVVTDAIETEISKVIVGQQDVVRNVVIALIAGGHVLLEGVPGLGKTLLVRTLADALDLRFSRIQFTPDLMPADITGTNIVQDQAGGGRVFAFREGPVFSNLVLADEINRATPKTQSALLEAMQEGTCTVANQIFELPKPFFVLATQNPLEMEGTYPLPEAQLDRFFFKLVVPFPSVAEMHEIVARTALDVSATVAHATGGDTVQRMGRMARQLPVTHAVMDYAVRLVLATHPDHDLSPGVTRDYVRYGASPRGAQAVIAAAKIRAILAGRVNVSYDDIRQVVMPALRHRIILHFDAEASGVTSEKVVMRVLEAVPETGF